MVKKSPSGASSPYYYKNGQLDPIHYGSYFHDMAGLADMMAQEEQYILKGYGGRRILIDVYDTCFTGEMLGRLAGHLTAISGKVTKLAFHGFSKKQAKQLEGCLKKTGCALAGKIGYYSDMEEAKTWLISEPFQAG